MKKPLHINPVYDWNCGEHGYTTTNEKDVNCPDCKAKRLISDYGKYAPTFPRIKFADTNSIREQTEHIASEAEEASDAGVWLDISKWATPEHLTMEILDTIHSCETALYILAEKHGIDINEMKRKVIEKNRERGYYL